MATTVGTAEIPITADMGRFQRDLDSGLGRADSGIGRFASRAAGLLAGAFAVDAAVDFFGSAISGASDLAEAQSRVNTIFGDSSGAINAWADGAATDIGLTEGAALDAAGTFGNMFTQLGIGSDQAARMSEGMVDLAADFSSFHNADISEVINAQSAAFRGEYDSLQRFLPLINAAAVEQRAMEMTGKDLTSELTAQEKALAVNSLMWEGAGEALGDFDRTSGGLANQQRILGAQFENLKTTIGAALMPVLLRVVSFLSQNMAPAFERIRAAVGQIAGVIREFWYTLTTGFTEDEGTPVERFALKVRELWDTIQPFVEWLRANWQPVLAGVALGLGLLFAPITTIVGGLALLYIKFEGVREVVDAVVSWLRDTAWPAIQTVIQFVIDKFSELVAWVRTHWAAIQEAIGHVIAVISGIVNGFIAAIQVAWQVFGDEILRVATVIWDQIKLVVETAINLVRGIIEFALALINGDWGAAWDAIKGIVETIWGFITGIVSGAIETVRATISAGLDAVSALWSAAWEGLKKLVSGAWENIKTFVSNGIDAVMGFISGMPGRIASFASNMWNSLVDAAARAWRAVVDFIDRMLGPIDEVLGKLGRIAGFGVNSDLGPGVTGYIEGHDSGGIVSGPRGAPKLILAHGGETILPTHKASAASLLSQSQPDPAEWGRAAARAYASTLIHELRTA